MPKPYKRAGSPFYWFAPYVCGRRRQISLRTRNYAKAQSLAGKIEDIIADIDLGLRDATDLDRMLNRNAELRPLVNQWEDSLADTAANADTISNVNRFLADYRIERLSQLDGPKVCEQLALFMDSAPSNRRANQYLRSVGLLAKWLYDRNYIRDPRVTTMGRRPERDDDRKIAHRSITPAEAVRLMAGERGLWYRFRLFTGLRGDEAKRVLRSDLTLSDEPELLVRKAVAKNNLECRMPLCRSLAEALNEKAMLAPALEIFADICERSHRRKLFNRDIEAAGIDPREVNERSLRMTFVTWLQAAGIDLYAVQRLRRDKGRGSDKLTVWTYSDDRQTWKNLRAAVDRLDAWFAAESKVKEKTA